MDRVEVGGVLAVLAGLAIALTMGNLTGSPWFFMDGEERYWTHPFVPVLAGAGLFLAVGASLVWKRGASFTLATVAVALPILTLGFSLEPKFAPDEQAGMGWGILVVSLMVLACAALLAPTTPWMLLAWVPGAGAALANAWAFYAYAAHVPAERIHAIGFWGPLLTLGVLVLTHAARWCRVRRRAAGQANKRAPPTSV